MIIQRNDRECINLKASSPNDRLGLVLGADIDASARELTRGTCIFK